MKEDNKLTKKQRQRIDKMVVKLAQLIRINKTNKHMSNNKTRTPKCPHCGGNDIYEQQAVWQIANVVALGEDNSPEYDGSAEVSDTVDTIPPVYYCRSCDKQVDLENC